MFGHGRGRAGHGHRGTLLTIPIRWYVLVLLTSVYAVNIADRFMISTLIEPIKADLHLSDSEIGLLTGVALALFYVTAGLPLALLADRSNRRNLISASLLAWSVATAACGLIRTFGQFMVARILVGVGEAGGTPPSHSLVSDYFPSERRALALSIYSIGASLGSMIGATSGIISEHWGWRAAFFVLGLPGVVLALLILGTMREPARGRLDLPQRVRQAVSFRRTLNYTRRQPTLAHCLIGGSVFTLWAWGLMWWTPSYLIRSHHLTLGAAGGTLLLIHGVGGTIALIATGLFMPFVEKRGPHALPLFTAVVIAAGTIPSIIAYSTSSTSLAVTMLWVFIPLSYCTFGPIFALVQNLVPAEMRSQAAALLLFFANIANLVVAPQLVGVVSDLLAPRFGAESLRLALLPLTLSGFWAALHFWIVARRTNNSTLTPGTTNAAGAGAAGVQPD
jgi:predicted MFS family arabinose efflux permease